MAEKERFYVHLVDFGDERCTASLIPRWSSFFTPEPPSAHGQGLDATLERLQERCLEHFEDSRDPIDRYLWSETMKLARTRVEVHPSTTLGDTVVLGKRTVPFWVSYGLVPMAGGGCRLVVPRFGDSMVLEDRSMAAEVIRGQWSVWLAGLQSRNLFELRALGEESVRPWNEPGALYKLRKRRESDEDQPVEAVLGPVAEEWVDRARRRRLDPVIEIFDPADHELLWDRYPLASILLVGEPGVGKTAWVRALAFHFLRWQRDAERDDPPRLWATSADRLMAGMTYLGQWEERCLRVADALAYEGDYLYVGRLHPILKRRGHSSIGDLWRENVAEQRLALIAECTPRELELCRRLNPGFLRPFRLVHLREPGPRLMADHVRSYVARRAKKIELKEGAVRSVLHLLDVYQRHQVFPGKAFRFLDVLSQEAERGSGTAPRDGAKIVYTETSLTRAFCRWSGLPEELVSDRHAKPVEAVAAELARGVVGQDEACLAAARVLTRFKAKIHDPSKPLGTLLFVGPTGVGKTELAKQLAAYMFGSPERMLRFDMSEFQAPGSARRLLAVGRGVRSLAQSIRRKPLSLVLLDELEKAHPEVFDLLLGVLGEGRLTDADGLTVDFRMSILVATSNLGVKRGADPGFADARPGAADYAQAVKRHFRPELVNRLDEIVSFRYLAPPDVEQIVDLMVAKARLRPGLQGRNLRLHVEPGARRVLARRGFHATHGARPLQRLIEDQVMGPLAVRLAENPSLRDRTVYVVDDPAVEVPAGSEKLVVQ